MPWRRLRLLGQRENRCPVLGRRNGARRVAEQIAESVNGEGAIVDLAEVGAKCADYYCALEAFVGFLGVVFGRPESEDD